MVPKISGIFHRLWHFRDNLRLAQQTAATNQDTNRAAHFAPHARVPAQNVQHVAQIPIQQQAIVDSNFVPADCEIGCDAGLITEGCGLGTCGSMCGCQSMYVGFELLQWWDKKTSIPSLVSTSPDGTIQDNAGVDGFSTSLFGGDDLNDDSFIGYRVTLGTWLNGSTTGVMARWFTTGNNDAHFSSNSIDSPILARPFFNVFSNEEDALLLGFPGQFTGNVDVEWENETSGFEVLMRQMFRSRANYRIDLLYGYRQLSVDEMLRVNNALEFVDPTSIAFGTSVDQFDSFDVENSFHGFDIGLMGHSVDGCWTLDFVGKVSLGDMSSDVTINGSTTAVVAGTDAVQPGGLLAQTSNIGTLEDNRFAVVPEFSATLGYALTQQLDLSIGYTFLYVSDLTRVGDTVDRSVNLTQQSGTLDGEARPSVTLEDSEYWLQGLNFGVLWRY